MLILPPSHAETLSRRRSVSTRERWMIGGVLGLVAAAIARAGPRTEGWQATPWWAWTGGLCGAVVLSATTIVAPRLGTASMIALVMAGQVFCSIVLDHYGLLGLPVLPVNSRRLTAATLLLAGAALMR